MPARLLVLQSDASPAFAGVAVELQRKFRGVSDVYTLGDAALRSLRSSRSDVIVAIGLPAALEAKRLPGKKVVFCQVFNYEEAGLPSPTVKGVSAMPPPAEQFRVWKRLDPDIVRIGVITGPRLRGLIADARRAARQQGMELVHVEIGSSMETVYAFKRLSHDVQGLWLLPDNRVLSRDVLREILSFGYKQGKQATVFSEKLLPLGGLLSAESDYADIAEQVLVRVRQAAGEAEIPGPDVRPLNRARMAVNPVAAKRFGLRLTGKLADVVSDS